MKKETPLLENLLELVLEREKERRIRQDNDTESECLFYFNENYPDTFKKQYPTDDIGDYYVDQSPNIGMYVSSIFTSYGIKIIDSWFSRQIINGCKYSKKQLEKMIKVNPHLHNIIKTNLLDNLYYKK